MPAKKFKYLDVDIDSIMNFPKITVTNQKILVISPICDKIEKLKKLREFNDEYIIIFTGEICYPWKDIEAVKSRIETLNAYLKETSSFYILGDGDLTFKSKNKNPFRTAAGDKES